MNGWWSSIAILLTITLNALAAPLPTEIEQFLGQKGRGDLIERWKEIPVLSPAEFGREFCRSRKTFVGAGYFGVVFRTEGHEAMKLSHALFSSLGMVALNPTRTSVPMGPHIEATRKTAWEHILDCEDVQALSVYREHAGVQVGGASVLEELYGELLAAAMDRSREIVLADAISEDGLAVMRPWLEGVSFAKILESQRDQTELHREFDLPDLWRQFAKWQRNAEALLFETGVTVDGLTPENFLVQKAKKTTRLIHMDTGVVGPSPEARALYRKWGILLPESRFTRVLNPATIWPVVPQHILYSRVWALSRTQALDYAAAWTRKTDPSELLRWIAQTPVLPIPVAPQLVDSAVVDGCAQLLATGS